MGVGEKAMRVIDVRQLVNGPISPVGISEDNALGWEIVVENVTVALEASLLGQLWILWDYLSALGIILRYNSEPEMSLFIS